MQNISKVLANLKWQHIQTTSQNGFMLEAATRDGETWQLSMLLSEQRVKIVKRDADGNVKLHDQLYQTFDEAKAYCERAELATMVGGSVTFSQQTFEEHIKGEWSHDHIPDIRRWDGDLPAKIEKLSLAPDDILVINSHVCADNKIMERLVECLTESGVKNTVLLLPPGDSVSKLTDAQLAEMGLARIDRPSVTS